MDQDALLGAVRRIAALSSVQLPAAPRLKQGCVPVRLTSERLDLRTASRTIPIRSKVLVRTAEALLPLLDGTRTADAIVDLACHDKAIQRTTAETCLRILASNELLMDASPCNDAIPYTVAIEMLTSNAIVPEAFAKNPRFKIADAAFDLAVGIDRCDVTIVVGTKSNGVDFRRLDKVFRESGQPWMHVCLQEQFSIVGPVFRPDGGPCYSCYELRCKTNDDYPESFANFTDARAIDVPNPFLAGIAAQIAVAECLSSLNTREPMRFGKSLLVRGDPWRIDEDLVLTVPSCLECGGGAVSDYCWPKL